MPGLASILNPNAPEGKGIHLYYNTNLLTLGLQLRDETKADERADAFAARADDRPGIIVNRSQLTSTLMTGVQIVAGLTTKKDTDKGCGCGEPGQKYDVSIIAPFYRSLSETQEGNTAIASCSSDDDAWVYFLTGVDGSSLVINEISPNGGVTGDYSGISQILLGSSLAAYYVPEDGSRFIIYQSSNRNLLHECSLDFGQVPIINSDNAKEKSPIAVAYAAGKAYLYYVDNSNALRYIVKSKGKWGPSQPVPNARNAVDDSSQVTVVVNGNNNHIFYMPSGGHGDKFIHLEQPHE